MADSALPPGFSIDPAPTDPGTARITVPVLATKGAPLANTPAEVAGSTPPAGFVVDAAPMSDGDAASHARELQAQADLQNNYLAALQRVHQNEYPGMSPEQFSAYAAHTLAPYSFTDEAQNAGLGGFGDEIGSAIGALGNQARNSLNLAPPASPGSNANTNPNFGQAFGDLQALEDARQKLGKANLGGYATAADILGALSSFGKAGPPNPSAIAEPLWMLMAKSAGVGGTLGAVEGAGSQNDNRAGGALTGAVGGALAGAVAPAVGHAVGSAIGSTGNWIASNAAARTSGISPEAAHVLSATMGADGSLGAAGAARLNQAGTDAMLADAGPAAQQVLDTAIQKSGPAGALANLRIGARVAKASKSINLALDTHLGAPSGVETLRNAIRTGSAPARKAAYDAAYASPIDYAAPSGQELEGLLARVRPGDIQAANSMMKEEGFSSKQILATLDADGNLVGFKKMPDVRQIDYLTRALNDRADATNAMGKLGGQTTAGRITQGLSDQIRDALKTNVDAYANALATAADPIRRSQAIVFGSKLLSRGTLPDQVANAVTNMTAQETSAVAQGIRSQIEATMANVTKALTDNNSDAREAVQALKNLSTRANREKVSLVIGPARAKALFDTLDQATKSFELRAAMAANSKTFTRMNMDKNISDMTQGEGPVGSLMRGEPVNAGKRGIQIVTGMTPAQIAKRQDALYLEIVDILTSPAQRGVHVMNTLAQLRRAAAQSTVRGNALTTSIGRISAPASAAAGAQSSQVAQ